MPVRKPLLRALRKELDKISDDLDAAWFHYYRTGRSYFDLQKIRKLEREWDALKELLRNNKEHS